MNGFICVNKPSGPSSFTIARAAGRALKTTKTGHAGTLDPMASGLMVIALGKCTRLLEYLSLEPKIYEFSVIFGQSTDTLDAEGAVIAESGVLPSENQLKNILKNFTGEQQQIPPKYSAIKISGTPAYKLARKGEEVEMKPRAVNIFSIDLRGYNGDNKQADFIVSCSSGTYVRSLARDIAKTAGAEGFVNRIHRTKTGRFDLSAAIDYQSLNNPDTSLHDLTKHIVGAIDAFDITEKTIVTDDHQKHIKNGKKIILDKTVLNSTLIAFDESGQLSAVLKKADGDWYHPQKVFY
ncbi:MAG: tRNA pseudouridine(55) synthase TruB [Chitinispirillales bacterium]|nr:tRNA pseudouridine(55) synthase TruB [Chitinispirillales bacterium]